MIRILVLAAVAFSSSICFAQDKQPIVLAIVDPSAVRQFEMFKLLNFSFSKTKILGIPVYSRENIEGILSSDEIRDRYIIEGIFTFSHGSPENLFIGGERYDADKFFGEILTKLFDVAEVSRHFVVYNMGCLVSFNRHGRPSFHQKLGSLTEEKFSMFKGKIDTIEIFAHPGLLSNLSPFVGGPLSILDYKGWISATLGRGLLFVESLVFKAAGANMVTSAVVQYAGAAGLLATVIAAGNSSVSRNFLLAGAALSGTLLLWRPHDRVVDRIGVGKDGAEFKRTYLGAVLAACRRSLATLSFAQNTKF